MKNTSYSKNDFENFMKRSIQLPKIKVNEKLMTLFTKRGINMVSLLEPDVALVLGT